MESIAHCSSKNSILAALPADQYRRIQPHLKPFDFTHGRIIYELNGPIDYMYFPDRALISLVTQMSDGKIIEVGLVGKDGMSGVAALLGQSRSAERAIVQIPNGGVRAKASVVIGEFRRAEALQAVLLRYINSLLRQLSRTAACNASHTVEERLGRWLLMCHDRIESPDLQLTQEFLADMLGTRRATVNTAALTLQSANLIRYNRGHISIVDRDGLENFSCECYEAPNSEIQAEDSSHERRFATNPSARS